MIPTCCDLDFFRWESRFLSSGIFSNNESHYKIAIELLNKYQNILEINKFKKVITTEVKMDTDFYYAEDYHQQYLAKNPQGYCGIQGLGFSIDID